MIDKFRSAMRSAGIETKAKILPNGTLHRFRVEGDKSGTSNGWYVLHGDGIPAGQFGSFKLGISIKCCDKDTNAFTLEDKALFVAKMLIAQQQRDEMQAKIHGECREWCKAVFETDFKNQPYFFINSRFTQIILAQCKRFLVWLACHDRLPKAWRKYISGGLRHA